MVETTQGAPTVEPHVYFDSVGMQSKITTLGCIMIALCLKEPSIFCTIMGSLWAVSGDLCVKVVFVSQFSVDCLFLSSFFFFIYLFSVSIFLPAPTKLSKKRVELIQQDGVFPFQFSTPPH